MDVLSLLRLLGRHWRITAPAALLTVLGVGVALQSSSPMYEATGSIVLLSPPEPPEFNDLPESAPPPEVGQNPFTRYGDLSVVADILARIMDSDSSRDEFESEGVTGYEVVVNRFQRGPVVDVTGQGPNPEAATHSTEVVLAEVDTVLTELQQAQGADPDYFIESAPLDPPSTATAMYGSTVRAVIATLAVGALATLGLAALAEALARRRTVRPTAAGPVPSDAPSSGSEGLASDGSPKGGWSEILSGLRLARQEPLKQRSAWRPAQQEPLKQEPAWQKTFDQEPSSEFPADNGHRRPTTDRSP
jgi:hypothetical protein